MAQALAHGFQVEFALDVVQHVVADLATIAKRNQGATLRRQRLVPEAPLGIGLLHAARGVERRIGMEALQPVLVVMTMGALGYLVFQIAQHSNLLR